MKQKMIVKPERGFTLIELMIVIALFAIIAFVATPITGAWIADADLMRTEGELHQAVGRAKSIALRNPAGASSGEAAGIVCISDTNALSVKQGNVDGAPDCAAAGDVMWSVQLDEDVAITTDGVGSSALSCMCFNSKGLLTDVGCSTCATDTTFTLAVGNKHVPVSLY